MGCGHVADFGHVPAILEIPGLQLAALFDPNPQRVREMENKFMLGCGFTRTEAFFQQNLDAVVIASPPAAHAENSIAAAKNGALILCEKPIADSEESGREMIEAVRAAGQEIYTAFVYRYSPVAQQIKRWVEEGIVGEVRSLRLNYLWNLHGQYEQDDAGKWIESARWRGRMLEGGPLVDCGVHQIDLARWWLQSEVVQATGHGAWVSNYEAPDHVFLHMDHANGAHTSIEVSFTYGHTAKDPRSIFTYELIGTGGVIRYDRDGYILEARHGQGTTAAPGASEKNFKGMYAALVRELQNKSGTELPSAEDGLIATSIAEAATEAAIAAHDNKMMQKLQQIG
jgi:predicted dehydrogenase